MSWIKMRTDLRTHPKVVRMASALKADRLRIIGGLWAVWGIFDTHSVDGTLEGYTLSALDDDLGWRGFSQAMATVVWLAEVDEGLEIPEFDEHNGSSAKRRAQDTKNKREGRTADKSPQDVRKKVDDMSATDADKTRSRVREEKEEEKKDKAVPNGTGAAGAPPKPADLIFALGVPLLTAANVSDRNARSMLGLLRKTHGDTAVLDTLQRCAEEAPLEPVAWIQAALKQRPTLGATRRGSPTDAELAAINAAETAKARERLFGHQETIDG